MGLLSRIFGGSGKKTMPIVPDYKALWERCKIDNEAGKIGSIDGALALYKLNKSRYDFVAMRTSIPSFLIFCLHYKEASCRFDGALHNGDKVIGNGKKTYNVPKGRGPFNTWEESAIDSILFDKNKFKAQLDYIPNFLESAERYNGLGHRTHGELSPYVWSYTNNHDETGNYVRDGVYDSDAPIRSAGVASLLKRAIDTGLIKTADLSGNFIIG